MSSMHTKEFGTLEKISGRSFEEIKHVLSEHNIPYEVIREPRADWTKGYMSMAELRVNQENKDQITSRELLGQPPKKNKGSDFYYADYALPESITLDEFAFRLPNAPTVKLHQIENGKRRVCVVESTTINYDPLNRITS